MNIKRVSGALMVSLMIHGIIMLVAGIFYAARTAQISYPVSIEVLQSKPPPVPQVRIPVIKSVPMVPLRRTVVVEESQIQPRVTTAAVVRPSSIRHPESLPYRIPKAARESLAFSAPAVEQANAEGVTVINNSQLNPPNGEAYHDMYFKGSGTNPFIDTEDDHLSTFAMDVDTGSYSIARRFVTESYLPPAAAIRVEEFINAFDYHYDPPTEGAFAIHLDGAPSKFGAGKRLQLLRIGLQGRVIPDEHRKDANLTFVIDVSRAQWKKKIVWNW